MTGAEWLTGDQVDALYAERRELHDQLVPIQRRMDEIDRALTASGESKVRAMREAEAWSADGSTT